MKTRMAANDSSGAVSSSPKNSRALMTASAPAIAL
jgi:hypothetical protein